MVEPNPLNPEKLTTYSRFSGCGAKLGPALLDKALCGLSQREFPGVLADYRYSEDSGVFQINEETAMVQSLDFFPPICDDPVEFGMIATANALSDIYAMGGSPRTALSIVCFPEETLDISYLRRIMEGALIQLDKADTALMGGHSVSDRELKFGLSVTGLIDPSHILTNHELKEGSALVLTKPIGTGCINTALRADFASAMAVEAALASMKKLNREASEILLKHGAVSCTDVTGFGLLGHLAEMTAGTAGAVIDTASVPVLPEAREYISMGLVPEGTYRNREYRLSMIAEHDKHDPELIDLLFDPQTSGGLLCALPGEKAGEAVAELNSTGHQAAVIGNVVKGTSIILE